MLSICLVEMLSKKLDKREQESCWLSMMSWSAVDTESRVLVLQASGFKPSLEAVNEKVIIDIENLQ